MKRRENRYVGREERESVFSDKYFLIYTTNWVAVINLLKYRYRLVICVSIFAY